MKKMSLLFAAAILCATAMAESPETSAPKTAPSAIVGKTIVPEYYYSEIRYRGNQTFHMNVAIELGQAAGIGKYMTDEEGRKLVFHSSTEALNYAIVHGWEFVQAYTTGSEDFEYIHLIIRIATSRLSQEERAQLEPKPDVETAQ